MKRFYQLLVLTCLFFPTLGISANTSFSLDDKSWDLLGVISTPSENWKWRRSVSKKSTTIQGKRIDDYQVNRNIVVRNDQRWLWFYKKTNLKTSRFISNQKLNRIFSKYQWNINLAIQEEFTAQNWAFSKVIKTGIIFKKSKNVRPTKWFHYRELVGDDRKAIEGKIMQKKLKTLQKLGWELIQTFGSYFIFGKGTGKQKVRFLPTNFLQKMHKVYYRNYQSFFNDLIQKGWEVQNISSLGLVIKRTHRQIAFYYYPIKNFRYSYKFRTFLRRIVDLRHKDTHFSDFGVILYYPTRIRYSSRLRRFERHFRIFFEY